MNKNIKKMGRRAMSFLLAAVVLTGGLLGAFKTPTYAATDASAAPDWGSFAVDDSTEGGKLLQEMLNYMQDGGYELPGENTPIPTWGDDLIEQEWLLEGTMAMVPAETDISLADLDISQETIDALASAGLHIDADGDGLVDQSFLSGLLKQGLKSAIKRNPSGMIDWGVDNLMDWVFDEGGDNTGKEILNALNEISHKLDEIKRDLERIMEMLKEVIDKIELNNYRADRADASNARDPLQNVAIQTRLELEKAGKNEKERKQVLDRFNKTIVGGTNVYIATANLGTVLTRTNNASGKDMCHILQTLMESAHFPWAHQRASFYNNSLNYYMSTYLEMLAYCEMSLAWQMEKNKDNKNERDHYLSIYEMLITGNKGNVVGNAQIVLKSVETALSLADDPLIEVYRTPQQWSKIMRRTDYSTNMIPGRPWDFMGSYPDPKMMVELTLAFSKDVDAYHKKGGPTMMDGFKKQRYDKFKDTFKTTDVFSVFKNCGGINLVEKNGRGEIALVDNSYLKLIPIDASYNACLKYKTIDKNGEIIDKGDENLIAYYDCDKPNGGGMKTKVSNQNIVLISTVGEIDTPLERTRTLRGTVVETDPLNKQIEIMLPDGGDTLGDIIPSSHNTVTLKWDENTAFELHKDAAPDADITDIYDPDTDTGPVNITQIDVGDTLEAVVYEPEDHRKVDMIDGDVLQTKAITVVGLHVEDTAPDGTTQGEVRKLDKGLLTLLADDGKTTDFAIGQDTIVGGSTNKGLQLGDWVEVAYKEQYGGEAMHAVKITVLPLPTPLWVQGTVVAADERALILAAEDGQERKLEIDPQTIVIGDTDNRLLPGDFVSVTYIERMIPGGSRLYAVQIERVEGIIDPIPAPQPIIDPVPSPPEPIIDPVPSPEPMDAPQPDVMPQTN